ncbi:MAG: hypothetical protein J6Z31_10700 [Fibrobacter sp.]|nr:hypothetical protein [Fibrobacter sp.]
MSIISKPCRVGRLPCHCERSEAISFRVLAIFLCAFLFSSCSDFDGPWTFYPEDSVAYRGIYTHGYIVAGQKPHVCFSKLYALEESASENFAFYDSASVTVSGKFANGDSVTTLSSTPSKPNCFVAEENALGVAGERYTLNAVFKWDSSGSTVLTRYSGEANIPTKISAVTVTPPGKNVSSDQKPVKNTHEYLKFEFQEFPYDLYTYSIAMDYDSSVKGMLLTLSYNANSDSSGESMNTTVYNMLKGFLDKDSAGYYGWTTHEAGETTQQMGFESRLKIGDFNNLDTMFITGVQLPIGKSTVKIYAVDKAYADYQNYLLESFEDSRVSPRTNIENGNGVFAGMLLDSVRFDIHSEDYISYSYAKVYGCDNHEDEDGNADPWNTKFCRLFQEEYCSDSLTVVRQIPTCYPVAVKFAMMLDTSSWAVYLPDTIPAESKSEAYADGLKRYCVSSNFKSNSIADCSQIYADCQVSLHENSCKDYIWKWCSDRDWDLTTYPQCGTALVSEYYLENLNSNVIQNVVKLWCKENADDPQCER